MKETALEKEIEYIISNFNVSISEYEIIDMEEYQGWSSKQLYLIVAEDENYILKAKTDQQISGYDNEVKISNALINYGIDARKPILTKDERIFFKHNDLYWSMMTYIAGAASHTDEYKESTIFTLAKHIDEYVVASMTIDELKSLDIRPPSLQNKVLRLERFYEERNELERLGIVKADDVSELYKIINGGYKKHLEKMELTSLIHNDINPRNILIDHTTGKVVSLIDWDHARYGNPLKDLSDAVAIMYDYMPFERASKYKDLFYNSFSSSWFTEIDKETVDFAFLFYYTAAKWRAVLFYFDLLKEYDNKYGEEERFINEMKQAYGKWRNMVASLSA